MHKISRSFFKSVGLFIFASVFIAACGGGGGDEASGGGEPSPPVAEPSPPVASAGNDQTQAEGVIVTLDGSGSTGDGSLIFAWTQVSGTQVTLSDTSAEKPQFTAPELLSDETLVFQLVVNNSLSATTNVTIVADNDLPLSITGADQSAEKKTTVILNGSASSDPENQTLTFLWTQTAGTTVTLSNTTAEQPQFVAPNVDPQNLTFQLIVNDGVNNSLAATVNVAVTHTPHSVVVDRELMITDLSVVESVHTNPGGRWTFEHLITQMMPQANPTAQQKSDFVLNWLSLWTSIQSVNGFSVAARNFIQSSIIDPWLLASGGTGTLDLSLAPFRLLAIVNRLDLAQRDTSGNVLNAGEGRFVFGVLDSSGFQLQFTMIFEYGLPATTEGELNNWIADWHQLSLEEFSATNPAYNNALLVLTDRFVAKNANPGKPNGSALNQLRSNEIALSSPWELREFMLSSVTGELQQVTVKDNPDLSVNNTTSMRDFINNNTTAILNGNFSIPDTFQGQPFVAGASINTLGLSSVLRADGITNNGARHKLSLNTCMGCHGRETNTGFLHVNPRSLGFEAFLSGFLKGDINSQAITVLDPIDNTARQFFDLDARRINMECLVIRCDLP
ncbi:hypothetical protein JYT31_02615 [Beggiatoa alba]|nr:hypothetical protein [Beggiatoa alba]